MIRKIVERLENQIAENLEELELIDKARAKRVKASKNYKDYIASKEWEETRREIFAKYGYRCVICGSEHNLHVHHITYENLGEEKDGDLVALCPECHKCLHDGAMALPFHNLRLTLKIVKNLAVSNDEIERMTGQALLPIITEANEKAKAEIRILKERWDSERT